VGGVTLAGGEDKSYYVKYNGKTFKLSKKDYAEKFKELFASCPKMLEKYPKPNWSDFALHIFMFDTECQ
jgi:hypothetical protein